MSFRWPNKDPDEELDYNVDWSRFLGEEGVTVASVNWYVDDADGVKTSISAGETVNGIQNVSETNTNTVTTINLSSGTTNTDYKFYCSMTDSVGLVTERVIKLRVKER
jgi:hypothetical protein